MGESGANAKAIFLCFILKALYALTDSLGRMTSSEEIFFRVPQGQLKLRLSHPGKDIGELIAYKRHPTADLPATVPHFFVEARTSTVAEAAQLRASHTSHTLSKNAIPSFSIL